MNKAKQHPAGISGVFAAALVVVAKHLGVDLSVEESVILVSAVAGVVSLLHPRNP